jgi:DNA primase
MGQERQVVIVEGYMDAVMAHQHGFHNVVATLGTAITEQHLRVLRRQVDDILLALDPDAAGQAATWRALQLADASLRTGLAPVVTRGRQPRYLPNTTARLLVMALPDGQDPDELIRSDAHAWRALVREAVPVVDFVLSRLGARHDLTTAQGKAAAAAEVVEVLAGVVDPIEKDAYVELAANALKVQSSAIRALLRRSQRPARSAEAPADGDGAGNANAASPAPTVQEVKGDTDDEYLLALLMYLQAHPAAAPAIDGELEFIGSEQRAVARVLSGGGEMPPELEPYARRAQRFLPDVERLPPQRLADEVQQTRDRIRTRLLEQKRRELNALLRDGADEVEVAALLVQNARQLPPERESVGTR